MRKFLVVGCGGSGGATLAYMMDQLKSELSANHTDQIPAGWQFVHIDVPVAPDGRISGIGNVLEQGGQYLPTGPLSGSYPVLDNAVSQTLAGSWPSSLNQIGTWAPRDPENILTPIHLGAGQMRAVGRMITLSKASEVYSGLERAYQKLNLVETNSEMSKLRHVPGIGEFNASEPPIVLVVSSMAGGAGASMALDVCRLLSLVPGVSPRLVGVFMAAADVFDSLPESSRGGVRANALAMLGEIVAAQTSAASEHDGATLAALGHQAGPSTGAPFARVFPVGRFAGTNRTLFGDGSQNAVYRGLGRGLAALMLSGQASDDFVTFDLTNSSDDKPARPDYMGWGLDSESQRSLSWGSFGFASLSMGRDRYREYSAQRLARTAVERLRSGHLQESNSSAPTDQLKALLDSQWSNICAGLQLPMAAAGTLSPQEVMGWFTGAAFVHTEVNHLAGVIAEEHLVPYIPSAGGIQAIQWLPTLRQRLIERKAAVTNGAVEAAYRWAYSYKDGLLERYVAQIELAISQFGLPYARALTERLELVLRDQLLAALNEMAGYGTPDVAGVPSTFEREIGAMRGVITNGQAVVDRLVGMLRGQATELLYSQAAGQAAKIVSTFISGVLAPMKAELSEALLVLDNAASAHASAVGLANVATEQFAAWPCDADLSVPERFDVADNEILITESKTFSDQYQADVAGSGAGPATLGRQGFVDTRALLTGQIIRGIWPVAGGNQAPGGLLEQTSSWQPGEFNKDPFTFAPVSPSRANFAVHTSPRELLFRAREFVSRPDESFDRFCSLSLRDYVLGTDTTASQIPARKEDVISKFNEAMHRAVPLISVNSDIVQQLHGVPAVYRFKFSAVPFKELDEVCSRLNAKVADPTIATETASILERAMNTDGKIQRIDIFGSYRNYAALAFDSVLTPVAQQWNGTAEHERRGFWSLRRTRPLPAALPLGHLERRAMVSGWFVAQIIGQLRLPEAPYDTAVEIWDAGESRWLQFPHPLLTPPSRFLAKSYDWLPAVLESILIATAKSHQAPALSSLKPYRALRAMHDSNPTEPASGLFEVAAIANLTNWLATGRTASGWPSRVPELSPTSTLLDRYEAAQGWLGTIRTLAGEHFMAPGHSGAPGGGSFSMITTRKQAGSTPIFADMAEDIFLVLGELLGHLDTALDRAQRGPGHQSGAPTTPTEPEPDIPAMPEIGAF